MTQRSPLRALRRTVLGLSQRGAAPRHAQRHPQEDASGGVGGGSCAGGHDHLDHRTRRQRGSRTRRGGWSKEAPRGEARVTARTRC